MPLTRLDLESSALDRSATAVHCRVHARFYKVESTLTLFTPLPVDALRSRTLSFARAHL